MYRDKRNVEGCLAGGSSSWNSRLTGLPMELLKYFHC